MENLDRGQRIRSERERLGLSQAAFADQGGASRSSQLLYEKGKPPTADYLAAIARAGVDVEYVLTGSRRNRAVASEVNLPRLQSAIEVIEEGLAGKTLSAAHKAEAVRLAYEFLAGTTVDRDRVLALVRRVAA